MRLLLARLLYRLRGPLDVVMWGRDSEYAILGDYDEPVRVRYGRSWVTVWTLYSDVMPDGKLKWHLTIFRWPTSVVTSVHERVHRWRSRDE